ncbi:MAG: carbon-nitrogen hydrolase family protein [Spirochaetes bacterium]|nr:carbon-nitrogen hydrolase family protein [Spirochaetota bacterium]
MKLRIIICQKPLGAPTTHSDTNIMRHFKPHFICFPEYFFVNTALGTQVQTHHNQDRQLRRISILSKELSTVVVGGTMPELADGVMYNTCHVYHDGKLLGSYRKKNLFFAEVGKITPGKSYQVFNAYGITFGVIICADVFDDDAFLFMKGKGARLIFTPTFSPKKEESTEDKYKRDHEIYVRGSKMADAIIVKVCGVKSEFRNFLQARSLIADKNGILYRVQPEEEDSEMIICKTIEV